MKPSVAPPQPSRRACTEYPACSKLASSWRHPSLEGLSCRSSQATNHRARKSENISTGARAILPITLGILGSCDKGRKARKGSARRAAPNNSFSNGWVNRRCQVHASPAIKAKLSRTKLRIDRGRGPAVRLFSDKFRLHFHIIMQNVRRQTLALAVTSTRVQAEVSPHTCCSTSRESGVRAV